MKEKNIFSPTYRMQVKHIVVTEDLGAPCCAPVMMDADNVKRVVYEREKDMPTKGKDTGTSGKEAIRKRQIPWTIPPDWQSAEAQWSLLHERGQSNRAIWTLMGQEVQRKRYSYRRQDERKGRYVEDQFLSLEETWRLLDDSGLRCYYCARGMLVLYDAFRAQEQWTLDRVDNDAGHNQDNVYVACLECNLCRRRRNDDDFLFTKQLVIHKHTDSS